MTNGGTREDGQEALRWERLGERSRLAQHLSVGIVAHLWMNMISGHGHEFTADMSSLCV